MDDGSARIIRILCSPLVAIYLVYCLMVESFKYIISGRNKKFRHALVALYAAIILLFAIKKTVIVIVLFEIFYGALILFNIFTAAFSDTPHSSSKSKSSYSGSYTKSSYSGSYNKSSSDSADSESRSESKCDYDDCDFFKGMSKAEAKKYYKELLKTHHPDNGGDPEMCKKINRAYDRFKAA